MSGEQLKDFRLALGLTIKQAAMICRSENTILWSESNAKATHIDEVMRRIDYERQLRRWQLAKETYDT